MAVILFLVVLFVLILVHEWGHFIVAKKTGMRVDEFGIGFPPKLTSVKKGETEYSLNALPIGGFVRILGENGDEEVSNEDRARAFGARPKWAQAAVLIAGVTMNVLFAWLLFVVIFMVGVPSAVEETAASESARLIVTEVLPGGSAAEAGVTPGAEIVSVSAANASAEDLTPSSFSAFTQAHEEIAVTYLIGGEEITTVLTPAADIIEAEPEQLAVGVALAMVEEVSQPFHLALKDATLTTASSLQAITVGLATLIADSFRGQADFSQVAGPVGIVGLVGDAAEFGFTSLLMFTAIISLNLAIINLLPFPALDGGRLVIVGIETVKGSAINPVWVSRVNALGFILLIALMVAITYNDVSRILG